MSWLLNVPLMKLKWNANRRKYRLAGLRYGKLKMMRLFCAMEIIASRHGFRSLFAAACLEQDSTMYWTG
jgi:hypothetical protein